MSAGSREEVLIRSMTEALCICLAKWLLINSEEGKGEKLEAIKKLLACLRGLRERFPIQLTRKEGVICREKLDKFHRDQLSHPDGCKPETVISMLMALIDHLSKKVAGGKNGKASHVDRINEAVMWLYDTFDQQGDKFEMMAAGAELSERLLK